MQGMETARKGEAMEATGTKSPYLTYEEAARFCRVNRTTLWRAARAGKLRESGPGMAVRFHRDDLDAWMRGRNRK
ncbi:MAG: helix-turn-helix domain-containing protein, partial [Rubrobacteraceae bacterium]